MTRSIFGRIASVLCITFLALFIEPASAQARFNGAKAYDYANAFDFSKAPSTARAAMHQFAVPDSSRQYLATHPSKNIDEDDPT